MRTNYKVLALAGALVVGATAAWSAGFFTNGVPAAGGSQYPTTIPLTGNETIPADTNLASGLNPASESVSTNQLAAWGASQPSRANALIGGDAGTNLFARATSGSSVTTTITYGGPDRWAYWSGTNTAMTVSRDSTAADLPAGYQYAFKMARTSGQTGVVQMCMAQEVESVNSYQFAGQTAELDFHAATGANFSAANAKMTAYIVYGTGTDEGTTNLAFGLNAGGGGAAAWTGQTNATAAVISLGAVSTVGRYVAFASIPATATEVAAVLCYTPVGTAGTNDYVAFSGIQLVRSAASTGLVSATAGYSCANVACTAFDRRSATTEQVLQQRYYWKWAETVSSYANSPFVCSAQSATVAVCLAPTPVTMRAAPTVACTFGTLKRMVAGTQTALTACAAAATTNGVSSANAVAITATVAAGDTAGLSGVLISGNSTGGGLVTASAEL